MKNIVFKTEIINNYLKTNNLTIKKFCERCNIKYYNFRQIMKNDLNVYSSIIYRVCKTMNIKLADLIIIK